MSTKSKRKPRYRTKFDDGVLSISAFSTLAEAQEYVERGELAAKHEGHISKDGQELFTTNERLVECFERAWAERDA